MRDCRRYSSSGASSVSASTSMRAPCLSRRSILRRASAPPPATSTGWPARRRNIGSHSPASGLIFDSMIQSLEPAAPNEKYLLAWRLFHAVMFATYAHLPFGYKGITINSFRFGGVLLSLWPRKSRPEKAMGLSPAVRQDLEKQLGKWAGALDEVQLQWASGYLAGMAAARAGIAPGVSTGGEPMAELVGVTIWYGSETGNGRGVAERLAADARARGFEVQLASLADVKPRASTKLDTL